MIIEEIINDVCEKEVAHNCYNYKINGIAIYHLIRRDVRKSFIKDSGAEFNETQYVGCKSDRVKAILLSLWHILTYRNKTKYLLHTFRLESINGTWLDRFMDPFIDSSGMNEKSYIIFETNKGRLYDNRLHTNNIKYDDFLAFISVICAFFTSFYLSKIRYRKTFNALFDSIGEFCRITSNRRKMFEKCIVVNLYRIKFYEWLLRKLGVEFVVAASRSAFVPLMCAAKKNGVKVYELQHGIVYGITVTYGGFNDAMFTPDKFLAFGDFKNVEQYGIIRKDFINIGFAFFDYIKNNLSDINIKNKDILILSQPDLTDFVIDKMILFAKKHKDLNFVLRCHPMEELTDIQKSKLEPFSNISIQNNKISSIVALYSFNNILGVLSSVIFEALAFGKNVGVLADGNYSQMLNEKDLKSFKIVYNTDSFESFFNNDYINIISVYSAFDKNSVKNLQLS